MPYKKIPSGFLRKTGAKNGIFEGFKIENCFYLFLEVNCYRSKTKKQLKSCFFER